MKIALITDTHWGVRNDSTLFLDLNKKFLDTVFFPELEKQNINTIIHLGDLVDRRKYVNILTATRVRQDFLDPLKERGMNVYIIAGNHDCFYKNTNKINALQELVLEPFHIIDNDPLEVTFDGLNMLLVPWICDNNRGNILECIDNTTAQICMGHFEIEKFPMYKGMPSEYGDSPSMVQKFDMVMSGHYHTRSHAKNIWYLGAHAEFTWSDYNDPRGFHIFDTQTRELTFIENPYRVFHKIFYKDSITPVIPDNVNTSIIKVVIQSKEDPYKFDNFIAELEAANPVELQIVEDHLNLHLEDESNIIDEAESTLDIFRKYIGKLEIQSSIKESLENLIVDLYTEAVSLEETWQ